MSKLSQQVWGNRNLTIHQKWPSTEPVPSVRSSTAVSLEPLTQLRRNATRFPPTMLTAHPIYLLDEVQPQQSHLEQESSPRTSSSFRDACAALATFKEWTRVAFPRNVCTANSRRAGGLWDNQCSISRSGQEGKGFIRRGTR